MEEMTERWLLNNDIAYERADDGPTHLDFYLPEFDIYIEVKRFHSNRIADQMSRAPNVIAVQGMESLQFLTNLMIGENFHLAKKKRTAANG